VLSTNIIITAAASGITIEGYSDEAYPDRHALIDRANTASNCYAFEIQSAHDISLVNLHITGGYYGIYNTGSVSNRLTVSDCTIFGNAHTGIYLTGNAPDAVITGNTSFNHNTWSSSRGLNVSGPRSTITGNTCFDNRNGIYASVSSEANRITVASNTVYSNSSRGIDVGNYVNVFDNVAYGHTASGSIGIYAYGWAVVAGNRAFNNTTGISIAGSSIYNRYPSALANVAYSNGTGIQASNFIELANNITYANTVSGLTVSGRNNLQWRPSVVRNNTLFQPVGTAVVLLSGAGDIAALRRRAWNRGGRLRKNLARCRDSPQRPLYYKYNSVGT